MESTGGLAVGAAVAVTEVAPSATPVLATANSTAAKVNSAQVEGRAFLKMLKTPSSISRTTMLPLRKFRAESPGAERQAVFAGLQIVEMGGLEPPTPYMRSDSGAKLVPAKKPGKSRKKQ